MPLVANNKKTSSNGLKHFIENYKTYFLDTEVGRTLETGRRT